MKILNENVSKNIIGELNKKSLKEEFNYRFTSETEFGGLSHEDALNTLESLAKYFDDYSNELDSNPEMYQGENRNVISEVSDLLYQAKQKLLDSWDNM